MAESSIRFLIDNCVTTICKEIGCLQEVSSRLSFCWGVLASCCSRIPISDTFEWLNLFTFVVDQLGRVYGMYCQHHSLGEEESVLNENKLPDDVAESQCEEVRSVFKWVCHAQSLLVEWAKKFSSQEINYDEIQLYHKNFSAISRVASLFYANAEMTDMTNLSALTTSFNQNVELLNIFMIRYVSGKPELGWYVCVIVLYGCTSVCIYAHTCTWLSQVRTSFTRYQLACHLSATFMHLIAIPMKEVLYTVFCSMPTVLVEYPIRLKTRVFTLCRVWC